MAWESRAHSPRRKFILVLALATAAVTLAAGTAYAGSGGSSGGGGVGAPKPPTLSDLSCLDRCAGLRKAAHGGKVELTGRRLANVDEVRFAGKGDDTTVKPTKVSSRKVEARVPDAAKDGKPRVIDDYGQVAKAPEPLVVVAEDELPEPGSFRLANASVTPEKAYFLGQGRPTLRYMFNGSGPTDVRIDLVSRKNGDTVESWVEEKVEPNSEQTVAWNGKADGKTAKSGEYRFRIGGLGDALKDVSGTTFGFYDHKFPVRAKHYYGDGFGAGRNHQGQDVFADCGTPMEAARGGKVQFRGKHSSAGNYLVIDGKGTTRDYMYAHMKKPAEVKRGEKVKTGERIGLVGETGNASGCHLHFELWGAPGWYEGGKALPAVSKQLKKWDKWS